MTLLLASASPRRAELLRQIGVAFTVESVPIDERERLGESPAAYVQRMAREKSLAAEQQFGARAILTADTTIALDQTILGKPRSRAEAHSMLSALAGRSHQVLSAVCLVRAGRRVERMSVTAVTFTALCAQSIERYLSCNESLDKAGGYAIQGRAAAFVERIEGSYSGVVGLPLMLTCQLFDEFAIPYWSPLP